MGVCHSVRASTCPRHAPAMPGSGFNKIIDVHYYRCPSTRKYSEASYSRMNSGDIGTSSRKRKADALGRLAESSSSSRLESSTKFSATGRGSVTGWTTCPLCGRHSQKRYALGRGISSHLHAVHTPWNPGKIERKKRRRFHERKLAEARRKGTIESKIPQECAGERKYVESWNPTQKEIEEWDAEVLKIVGELEALAADTSSMAADKPRTQASTQTPSVEFVKAGLDRSGETSQSYRDSLPLFLQAAADGNLSKLKSMVSEAADEESISKLLATRDRHLSSAEHWAAGGGHLSCLEYLLECRQKYVADATVGEARKKVRRRDGKTALHYAARNGHLECVRYLIEDQGYAVEEVSGEGTTPFHMACFGCHPDVAVYLLQRGARVDAANEWGCTAAHWLAMTRFGDPLVVRSMCSLLRDKGLSFVQVQKQGHSAMHKAAQRLNKHVIEWMLQPALDGGAGLSAKELREASQPDNGGHNPTEIWVSLGGDPAFAKQIEKTLQEN